MNMFANTMVARHGHESARQSPSPTVDMHDAFGVGTKGEKDTGAGLVERSVAVEITNPGMRVQAGAPVREEKRRLTARSVDVVARSGNQRPQEVMDSQVDHGFIWGQVGQGDEPTPMLGPHKPNWLLLGGLALGAFLLLRSTRKMADEKMVGA